MVAGAEFVDDADHDKHDNDVLTVHYSDGGASLPTTGSMPWQDYGEDRIVDGDNGDGGGLNQRQQQIRQPMIQNDDRLKNPRMQTFAYLSSPVMEVRIAGIVLLSCFLQAIDTLNGLPHGVHHDRILPEVVERREVPAEVPVKAVGLDRRGAFCALRCVAVVRSLLFFRRLATPPGNC